MRARRSPRTLLAATLGATLVSVVGLIAMAGTAEAAVIVVQAESYAAQSGVQLEPTADTGGGQNAAYLANGDWMRYDGVDLGAAGALTGRGPGRLGHRRRQRRAAYRLGDRAAARPVPDQPDRRLAELDHAVRHRQHPPDRRADRVRRPAQHRRRRLRQHQLVLVRRRRAARARRRRLGRRSTRRRWNAQLAAFNALAPRPVPGQLGPGARVQRHLFVQPLAPGRPDRLPGHGGRLAHAHLHRQHQHQREHHDGHPAPQRRHELPAGAGPVRVLDPDPVRARPGGRAEGRRGLLRLAADQPGPYRAVPAGLPDDRR